MSKRFRINDRDRVYVLIVVVVDCGWWWWWWWWWRWWESLMVVVVTVVVLIVRWMRGGMTEKKKENAEKGTDNDGRYPSSRIDEHELNAKDIWNKKGREWQRRRSRSSPPPKAVKKKKVAREVVLGYGHTSSAHNKWAPTTLKLWPGPSNPFYDLCTWIPILCCMITTPY